MSKNYCTVIDPYLQQTCRQLEAMHGIFPTMSPQKLGMVGMIMLIM